MEESGIRDDGTGNEGLRWEQVQILSPSLAGNA